MSEEEEKLQELVGHMKMIEAYLNDINNRENTVGRLIEEGRSTIDAIRNVSGTNNVQTFMPIGIGVYMQGSVSASDKLLVSIGAGIAVEKNRDDAINYIESRIKELEVALRTMLTQKHELSMKMEQTRTEVNSIMRNMQKKSG